MPFMDPAIFLRNEIHAQMELLHTVYIHTTVNNGNILTQLL